MNWPESCQTLKLEYPAKHVLKVTLNRPDVSNAFNTLMATELVTLFEGLALDQGDVRVVILTGSGSKAFCAGGDLKERNKMTNGEWRKQHLVFERMALAFLDCPLPIIGAINGAAYGGGCEICGTLDFLYAADHARFCLPETSLGIIPGAGGTQTLARAIGERRAKELILTSRPFSAQEAMEWGLVNDIFSSDELLSKALETAEKIAANAPISVRQAKQAIHRGLQMSLRDGLAFEIEAYNRTVPTEDRIEGVKAFNEKRKPEFKGQ